MDLLTGLVYVTLAAIALVIVHGYYRKWRDRRNQVVVKLERNIPQADIDLDLLPNSELPNGGARAITRETEPVIPRKRYQLKDGRDKVRQSQPEPEPANVPVLMDPLEIAETDIEHANVFVTAETGIQEASAAFNEDDTPPEVLAGDDGINDEHNDVAEEEADEFLAATADPLAEDDEFSEEFEEEFAEEFAEEFEEDTLEEADQGRPNGMAKADQLAGEHELAEDSPAETAYEDEEEYDPYEDENFYENEPALLENAYRLATRKFQRHQEPEQPRIEPGFGEVQGEEVEASEEFVSALDEGSMGEFLDQEQEEIRAWRNQSVTQQRVPPASAAPAPVDEIKAATESAPVKATASERATRQESIANPERVAPRENVAPQTNSTPDRAAPPIRPAARFEDLPEDDDDEELPDVLPDEEPETFTAEASPAPKAAEPPRENKPSFWQTVTGKTAPAAQGTVAKGTSAKIAQGELFQGEHNTAQTGAAPAAGPQEVIVVNVMAKPGDYFYGDEMLPVLQHFGLHLGQMNIFHRHTELDGSGSIMFSMANMVKPGTFALNGIEEFATPGISFFVQLPNRHGNMNAFEHMLATANGVKQALDGILKDERRSVLTRQTVDHCRQRIRDFELSLLARK